MVKYSTCVGVLKQESEMCLSRGACRNSHRLGGGEVGKEAEGVGGEVDISGVHRHSQQEHCNDDYTRTHTRTHAQTDRGRKAAD